MHRYILVSVLSLLVLVPLTRALPKDQNQVQTVESSAAALQKKETESQKVDALFAQWDKANSPGLALAVVKDGKTIYQRGYGMADLEQGLAITTSTVFIIASLSKHFTVFCILLLLQGGRLNLDDDVRKHVPEVPDFGKTITLRHLIHHTSGLRDHRELAGLAGWRGGDVLTERDLLRLLSTQKDLNFEPGSQFQYCNMGYLLLGSVAHRVSGKTLRDFAQENVFTPLGMTRTQFRDDCTLLIPNLAGSYSGTFPNTRHSLLQDKFCGPNNLSTTVEDLARWDRNFYDAKVGGPKVIQRIQEKGKFNDGTEFDYAGGLELGNYRGLKVVYHTGNTAGYRSALLRFPEQKFSVIFTGNSSNIAHLTLAQRVADVFLASEFKSEKATPLKDWTSGKGGKGIKGAKPAVEVPSEKQKEYVGIFYSDELEVIYQVEVRDNKLWLRHRKGEFQLAPGPSDQFTSSGGETSSIGQVHFTRGLEKTVTGMTVVSGRGGRYKFVRVSFAGEK